MSANDECAEWIWSDGRLLPTEITIDSTMSQHMGDVFVQFVQDDVALAIFVTADQWDAIDTAARRAIEHRRDLTEEGWT